jgi:NodT family efflux transporter outer membrane factor (OMF) lipoprotein
MRTLIALTALLLAGCALKTPPTPDQVLTQALPPGTSVPPQWTADPLPGTPVPDGWLKSFNDPALEAIVAEAIAHNPDLRAAASRVDVAQQLVVLAGAQLQPQVGAVVGGRTIEDSGSSGAFNSSQAYASVGWEIDVWGRLRAQQAAAQAGYEASALDFAFARQSLAALTARVWYATVESRQLLVLAEQAVQTYTELLRLVKIRRGAGRVADLDVAESSANLAAAQATLQGEREAYAAARRALELLVGRYPAAQVEVATAFGPLPPQTSAGLPATLLERRPDLIGAEREVVAAFRKQEAAELALLPDFSLGLAGGRFSDGLLSLLRMNPWMATATIGMSIPIYTGGALQAQVQIATAQQARAVASYGAVALKAFREVEDALAAEQFLALRVPYQRDSMTQRDEALRIAYVQYRAGRIDLLWVSQLQAKQIAAAAELVRLAGTQMANRIKLQLALGSSFEALPAAGGSPSPQGSPLNTSQRSVRNARELAESDEPVKDGAL